MPYLTPVVKDLTKSRSLTETNREDFPWEIDSGFYSSTSEEDYSLGEY